MTYCQLITQILRIIWVGCIPLSLISKTWRRATSLLPTWIYFCRSRVTFGYGFPFTTNVTISTSISSPGTWSHLWFAGVHECPPWCSIVGATVTVHQFFCILHFHITNFPFLNSNIPYLPAYGAFISQLIRYARACSSYECFILRAARLSSKLLRQGYVMERLKSSLRKFYGRYGDLIKHYEGSLSQMLHDILGHDHIQWHHQLIRHYTNLRTYYRTGL